ncbi:MAG: hypothetical protein JWM23_1249 [Microbacteriaceae bacterium]|nr:hypothetical protein [Microbacteriaceae bacterium]
MFVAREDRGDISAHVFLQGRIRSAVGPGARGHGREDVATGRSQLVDEQLPGAHIARNDQQLHRVVAHDLVDRLGQLFLIALPDLLGIALVARTAEQFG